MAIEFLEASEQRMSVERYDLAGALIEAAAALLQKGKEPELQKEARTRETEWREYQKLWMAAESARRALAANSADAEAELAVGSYLAIARLDWEAALPHLAKSRNGEIQAAAQFELQSAKDPGRWAEIGGTWLDLADKAEKTAGPAKTAFLEHARTWYLRGAAGLTGSGFIKAQSRFKKIEMEVRRASGAAFVKRHPLRAVSIGGHWYEFIPDRLPWHQARKRCLEMGGDLVCLESAPECQWAYQFAAVQFGAPEIFSFWTGGTDEGHEQIFAWVNGNPMQFADWKAVPTRSKGKKGGGGAVTADRQIAGTPQFKWGETAPTANYSFICEWER